MNTQTKPSSGAVRAATVLLHLQVPPITDNQAIQLAAEIVDRESGLAELLEAAKGVIDPIPQDEIDECEQYKRLQLAIRSAGNPANPNAETVQSYPSGRWTEKGTV